MKEGYLRARVYRSAKRDFECKVLEGELAGQMITATALGNLLKGDNSIVVGDYVGIEKGTGDEWQVQSAEARTSEVFRILVREQKKKVVACNVDLLVIVISVSKPQFKRGIIDRFLIRASEWGIKPVVIFNKMDEYDPNEFDICFERDRLQFVGAECFEISALDPLYQPRFLQLGFRQLTEVLKGRTAIFLGQSGVGKSKTINMLANGEVELKTNAIGKANKGAHTTTWAEIIDLDLFTLIDSPGVRSFSLQDMLSENFIENFPDLEELATRCKFSNCDHSENAKGCAFHSLPDPYQKELYFSRLESFWRILEELKDTPDWMKK